MFPATELGSDSPTGRTITTKDGTRIYYKDWGCGQPVVLCRLPPPACSSPSSSRTLPLKVYKGAPHGLCTTHKHQVNEDLPAFLRS